MSFFEQKEKTNEFLVSFLISLERYYFESREMEFAIELIEAFQHNLELLRANLQTIIKIKERLTLHYLNSKNMLSHSLDNIIVKCNDWPSLFKGLSFLFKRYETLLIRKLVNKLKELGTEHSGEKVQASVFMRAVFLLQEQEDVDPKERMKEESQAKRKQKVKRE